MTEVLFQQLQTRAALCGVTLNSAQLTDINTYCTVLTAYNQHTNLVSRTDLDFLLFEHVLDSLSILPLIQTEDKAAGHLTSLIDIGSGAGFPALILAITNPLLRICLVEATAKKCKFLTEAAATLKLSDRVQAVNARAEDLGRNPQYRNKFQLATARAVGSLELITELAIPLLQEDGCLLAQKSQAQAKAESASAKKLLTAIGASLEQTVILNQEALGKKCVVLVVKKTAATPDKFPRPFSKIKSAGKSTRFPRA